MRRRYRGWCVWTFNGVGSWDAISWGLFQKPLSFEAWVLDPNRLEEAGWKINSTTQYDTSWETTKMTKQLGPVGSSRISRWKSINLIVSVEQVPTSAVLKPERAAPEKSPQNYFTVWLWSFLCHFPVVVQLLSHHVLIHLVTVYLIIFQSSVFSS